ncbi:DUF6233 domain-containing protein [Streptomyces sp. NPDC007851]|uniref:DUF6233 domain-containing protein n=1 Tax=Streptomyces sp. NPDC007851 TaxID=3155008 RepID=UPI0033E2BFF7
MRVWHAMWLWRVDAKITGVSQGQAETERGRRTRPRPPDRIAELGIGGGRPPVRIHAGTCHMAGKRSHPVGQNKARRLLANGITAWTHRRPDAALGMTDLASGWSRKWGTRYARAARLDKNATRPKSRIKSTGDDVYLLLRCVHTYLRTLTRRPPPCRAAVHNSADLSALVKVPAPAGLRQAPKRAPPCTAPSTHPFSRPFSDTQPLSAGTNDSAS